MKTETRGALLQHLDQMRALLEADEAAPPPAPVREPGRLSDNFTLAEMTHTGQRLDNTPPAKALAQLYLTADRMERVRSILGDNPIRVTSGYRSPAVNKAVGGSANSAHMTGHAVDFTCPGFGTIPEVVAALVAARDELGPFDQIIEEFGSWVHIGFGPGARGEVLVARRIDGRVVYRPWSA